ncbi:metalloregulator ArsR/SmtB family transcription factor [Lamprocystis purpurea]|uniref:metalloregulator ArsR/SmtB family transcription factor n=1 Tax=Lamprocystis purpurea TaxID=61598 RepID=UPI00036046C6|nr:metalloregulator ArsR/SmtB family transcription factor [Lamprocystis purpurea]
MLDPQAFFESLADPIRRRILAMLLESDERCVCDIHGALDVPQPKVSRHLAVLRGADLVLARRDGVWMHYRIHPQLPAWALRILIHMKDGMGPDPLAPPPSRCDPRARSRTTTDCTPSATPEDMPMTAAFKTVLVLCTGNSCRSQMAEVLLNHDLAGQVRALSAGTRPQPKVADGAIAALQAAGLPTDGLYPKDIDSVLDASIDLVVTVCDNAKESCPIFPRPVTRIHLPFHDPHGEPLESFIEVRDAIRARLVPAVAAALGLAPADAG